jgi:hypothetical protein
MLRKVLTSGMFSPRRRALSRRRFLQAVAGTAGALGAGLLLPRPALAAGRDPNPNPGGQPNPTGGPYVHANFPGPADTPGPGTGPLKTRLFGI